MKRAGAPDASARALGRPQGRAMARRVSVPAGTRLSVSLPGAAGAARRIAMGVGIAALALVAAVGTFAGQAAGHAPASPAASAVAAGSAVSDAWGAGGAGSIDLIDLTWKGLLVLALLFVTLRVLARVQGVNQVRRGHLKVLESRTIASKASLHLVAVGERRLVVGLTPAGMVALAELDADELPDEDVANVAAGTAGAATPGTAGTVPGSAVTMPATAAASAFRAATAPIDNFAARLATALRREQSR